MMYATYVRTCVRTLELILVRMYCTYVCVHLQLVMYVLYVPHERVMALSMYVRMSVITPKL